MLLAISSIAVTQNGKITVGPKGPVPAADIVPLAINMTGIPLAALVGVTTLTNTAPPANANLLVDVSTCSFTDPVTFNFVAPLIDVDIAPGESVDFVVGCVAPALGGTTVVDTLHCESNALTGTAVITDFDANGIDIPVSCSSPPRSVPVIGDMGKILLASLVIALGLLDISLRRKI